MNDKQIAIMITALDIHGEEASREFNVELAQLGAIEASADTKTGNPLVTIDISKLYACRENYDILQIRVCDPPADLSPDVSVDCKSGEVIEVGGDTVRIAKTLRALDAPQGLIDLVLERGNVNVLAPENEDLKGQLDVLRDTFHAAVDKLTEYQRNLITDMVKWSQKAGFYDEEEAYCNGNMMITLWADAWDTRNAMCLHDQDIAQFYAEGASMYIAEERCTCCGDRGTKFTCFDCGVTFCLDCYVDHQQHEGRSVLDVPSVEFAIQELQRKAEASA